MLKSKSLSSLCWSWGLAGRSPPWGDEWGPKCCRRTQGCPCWALTGSQGRMPFEVLQGDSGKLPSIRAGDSELRRLGKVGGLGRFLLRDRNCAVDAEVTEVGWGPGGLDLCHDVSASSDAFPGAQVLGWGLCEPSFMLSSPGSAQRL